MFRDRGLVADSVIAGQRRRVINGAVAVATVIVASSVLVATGSVGAHVVHRTVDPNAPETAAAKVIGSDETIIYDIIDGMAIVEKDIILGTHAEVQAEGI